MRRPELRGLARVDAAFTFAAATYNQVRAPKLLANAMSSPATFRLNDGATSDGDQPQPRGNQTTGRQLR
jgi:hypothetical protein